MENVQVKVLQFAPDAYKNITAVVDKMDLTKLMSGHSANKKDQKVITSELVKMLSLAPESLANKMQAMSQCLVNKGMLKTTEAKMVSNVMSTYAKGDIKETSYALGKLINMDSLSEGMRNIIKSLRSLDSNNEAKSQAGNSKGSKWNNAPDLGAAIGTIVGGIIGLIVGGIPGLGIGLGLGAAIGKAVGTILKGIFGKKSNGFMPGPNGEDCTPPFSLFG